MTDRSFMSELNSNSETRIRPQIIEKANELPFRFEILSPERLEEALTTPDLTSEGSLNAVNVIKDAVIDNLHKSGFANITIHRQHPIVSTEDNFDILRFPTDNAGRSSRYTRYVDEEHVLRTHTSAMVPGALRSIAEANLLPDEEVTIVMPGLCFRRDVTDREHLGIFHQMDIWVIKKNGSSGPYTQDDLLRLADAVYIAANPGSEKIIHAADHPYTLNGIEAYSEFREGVLEIFEAGLAHPEVLEKCGLDPLEYSGLALGMGLDRLVMARKNMPDIRLIRSEHPEILAQMMDLEAYTEISTQPPINRDISYVVDSDISLEDVSDQLQVAFGDNSYLLESVEIKSVSTYDELPENVRERIGITPGKVNVLVNFILRHPDRTLTKKEVNVLSNNAYKVLHRGTKPGYLNE